jgi:hypothetical protein
MLLYILNIDYVYFHVKGLWITLNLIYSVSNEAMTLGISP